MNKKGKYNDMKSSYIEIFYLIYKEILHLILEVFAVQEEKLIPI